MVSKNNCFSYTNCICGMKKLKINLIYSVNKNCWIVFSSRICPSELIALSDRVSEFRALNTEVVACSVDSYLSHQAWSRTLRSDGGIAIPKMPLLSDPTHAISKSYGCYLPELGHSLRYIKIKLTK